MVSAHRSRKGETLVLSLWTIVRWVHLLSAMVWIGGQLFILLVLLPVMRGAFPSAERTLLFTQVARRFGLVSWVALALLVVTEFINGERRSIAWSSLGQTHYSQILAWKIALVAVVITITLVHALYLGRRLAEIARQRLDSAEPASELERQRRRLQRASIALSGLNLLLNLIIVWLAAALVA